MFYLISEWLCSFWGPVRLLQSHVVMMGGGALLAALLVWLFLPKLAKRCPVDRGKVVTTADGKTVAIAGGADAKAKPTGTGAALAVLLIPVLLCFFPIYIIIISCCCNHCCIICAKYWFWIIYFYIQFFCQIIKRTSYK